MKQLKIKNIKKIGKKKVYNISVEDNHNYFLSNGILSKNSFGKIGGGKSVSTLSIIQGYHDCKGYKVWDLFGGERNEGLYWTLPSEDKEYWQKIYNIGTPSEEGPKQYQVNLFYPHFATKLPKKLPKKGGFVNSKIFTIPLSDIEEDDIRMVLGNIAESNKYVWQEVKNSLSKKDTGAILPDLSKKYGGVNTTFHKNFAIPLSREHFLMDKYCDYNLDLKEEGKNKEVISVLCLDFIPEKYHLLIINYWIRKIVELVDLNHIKKKNILFIREAATFFRATDDSILEDKFKIFRTNMSHYIRMGRRGTHFCLDCQSSSEVRGIISGSEDFLLMFKTTAWRDKAEMTDELKRERRMRSDQIADLAFLEKGEVYIAETGKVVKKVQIILPRTMYWKKEYPNFYRRFWEQHNGEWSTTTETKEIIIDIAEINKKEFKAKEMLEEAKKKKPNKRDMSMDIPIANILPKNKPDYDPDYYPPLP